LASHRPLMCSVLIGKCLQLNRRRKLKCCDAVNDIKARRLRQTHTVAEPTASSRHNTGE